MWIISSYLITDIDGRASIFVHLEMSTRKICMRVSVVDSDELRVMRVDEVVILLRISLRIDDDRLSVADSYV